MEAVRAACLGFGGLSSSAGGLHRVSELCFAPPFPMHTSCVDRNNYQSLVLNMMCPRAFLSTCLSSTYARGTGVCICSLSSLICLLLYPEDVLGKQLVPKRGAACPALSSNFMSEKLRNCRDQNNLAVPAVSPCLWEKFSRGAGFKMRKRTK